MSIATEAVVSWHVATHSNSHLFYYAEEDGSRSYVEIGSPLLHNKVLLILNKREFVYELQDYVARKTQGVRTTDRGSAALRELAINLMMGRFRGIQPKIRPVWRRMIIEGWPVHLRSIERNSLTIEWRKHQYTIDNKLGEIGILHHHQVRELRKSIRLFAMAFAPVLWSKLPPPKVPDASQPLLFGELPVDRRKKKKQVPTVVQPFGEQPRDLFLPTKRELV